MEPSARPSAVVHEELKLGAGTRPLDVFEAMLGKRGESAMGCFFERSAGDVGHTPAESILALDPLESVRVQGRDPFVALRERLSAYRTERVAGLPSFQGGALGYFAYDSVRFLEPSLGAAEGNLSRPDERVFDGEFLLFSKVAVFDHARGVWFVIAGVREERAALVEELRAAVGALEGAGSRRKPRAGVKPVESKAKPVEFKMSAMSPMLGQKRFVAGVRKLKEHIRAGDIFQAVLAEKLRAPFDPSEDRALELYRALEALGGAPYRFYFCAGGSRFVGASPELLLKLTGRELETHPIAGTRPRGKSAAAERKLETQLLRSEKERAEHLMLVDLARNDLGRVSEPGSVRVDEYMKLRKFSGVMHLVSRVTGRLAAGIDSIAALAACFPAGTLSGAPKIRAMQLLSELEPERRGFYGGAFVAASFTGDLDSCISIRSLELTGREAIVQAGAGIVADSQASREHDEVKHKSRNARRALAQLKRGARPSRRARRSQRSRPR